MIRLRRLVAAAALCAAIAGPGAACRAPARALDPQQRLTTYSSALRVEPDGTLDVTEDFVFAAPSTGESLVRRVPVHLFDRVEQIAWHDGNPESQSLTSADRSGGLDVTVPLRVVPAGGHLELTYRVLGAVAVRGGRGLLTWDVFPEGHPFAIDAASIGIVLPESMVSAADPPAPAAGWTVQRTAHGWSFEASRVPPRTPVTVTAELAVDPNAVVEPEWQALETRARQLMPAFASAAFFILVTGGFAIWMVRWQLSIAARGARTPRELDPSAAARGLVVAGWILIVFGLVSAAATWHWFTYFGAWPVTVPLSVAIVGALFVPEAARMRRHPR